MQFEKYQIYDPEEQQLILRLFKRFYYGGVIKKYGHFKKQITLQSDPPEISARALCNELELNPKILRLAGIFPTFGSDAQVNWTNFVTILAMFLLRKEVLDLRYQLILNFLQLKDSWKPLMRRDYIQYEFQKYKFGNRTSTVVITTELQ